MMFVEEFFGVKIGEVVVREVDFVYVYDGMMFFIIEVFRRNFIRVVLRMYVFFDYVFLVLMVKIVNF